MGNQPQTTKKSGFKNIMNFLAYIAVIVIGLALIFSLIFKTNQGEIAKALSLVSQILSYLLVAYYSLMYVKTKRNWVHYLIWAIAVGLIVVSLVLTGF